ncbi:hypothetical protein KBY58_12545 [Cyanobium sp. HWJ4-Hawea]|nr:hypothetical protein [Cyanobium sp. HWJ4-Hawea]
MTFYAYFEIYTSTHDFLSQLIRMQWVSDAVTARKDDADAAAQAAIVNVGFLALFSSGGGGLIQTTFG